GQQIVAGKLLWLSFTTVVVLHEVMRQRGSSNTPFVELLSRLREGRCTQDDYELLHPEWADAPIIVYDNATKDALNVRAAEAFARNTGRELHWYYARD
ncbi:hypothetical protein OH77DRAFT_1386195, partial [Trametes cingulata]